MPDGLAVCKDLGEKLELKFEIMLIVMKPDAPRSDVERVIETIEKLGLKPHELPGANRTAIGLPGNPVRLTRRILKICRALRTRFASRSLTNSSRKICAPRNHRQSRLGGNRRRRVGDYRRTVRD
jgi:hypothetical protein